MKYIIIPVLLIVAISASLMFLPSNISRQEAQEIAVNHVGGGFANWAERSLRSFQRAWSVEVFYYGMVHEVYINSRTGEIIGVEIEVWH